MKLSPLLSAIVMGFMGVNGLQAQEFLREMGRLEETDSSFEDNTYFDKYEFEGRAGQRISVTLSSEEFEPYILIKDSDGKSVEQSNRCGNDARLMKKLEKTDRYTIYAKSSVAGATGQYQLLGEIITQEDVQSSQNEIIQQEAESLFGKGKKEYDEENFREARMYWEQALTRYEQINNCYSISQILNFLGLAHRKLGEYHQAIEHHQQALMIKEELNDLKGIAEVSNSFGIIYRIFGEYDKALEYYERALEINKELGDRSNIAKSLNNIGIVYYAEEDYDTALEYHEKSLQISQELNDESGIASSLNNLGDIHRMRREYVLAQDYYEGSLKLKQELNSSPAEIAKALNNLGMVALDQQDYEKALGYYEQSLLGLMESDNNPDTIAQVYSNMGKVQATKGEISGAIAFYKEAVKNYEQVRARLTNLDTDYQESYAMTVEDTYRELAALLLEEGKFDEAEQVIELLKVQEIKTYTRSQEPTEGEVYMTEQEEIFLDNYIEELIAQRAKVAESFQDIVDSLEEVRAQRRAEDKQFLDPEMLGHGSTEDFLAQRPDSVLIYPLVLEDKIWVFWATAGGMRDAIEVNNVNRSDLTKTISGYQLALEDQNSLETIRQKKSQQLYDWLLPDKLMAEIEKNNITNLIFALDHVTRYIPLETLYDGQDYLIDRYTTSTIISVNLTNQTDFPSKPSVLGMGASEFEQYPNLRLSNLPHVPTELNHLIYEDQRDGEGIFPGQLFLNEQFNADTMLFHSEGHNVLHLATHAIFDPSDAKRSRFILGDGTPYTIANIQTLRNLNNIKLAVLSACETAVGQGTEIAGISSYFINGGVDTVIASLWKVNDESTSVLMQAFYANLAKQMPRAKAFRQAKLELKASAKYNHPYYWSPFILIGNER